LVTAPSIAQERVSVRNTADGSALSLLTARGERQVQVSDDAILSPRLHVVPGSDALGMSWSEEAENGPGTSWYSVSVDGERFNTPKQTDYSLLLRFAAFDPLSGKAAVPPDLMAPKGSELYVVQFWTQGIEAYRESLRRLGVRLHLFLANHSHVVQMSATQAERVRDLSFVRWVGPFHPAYKLEQGFLSPTHRAWSQGPTAQVNILTMERGLRGQTPVAELITSMGGVVESTTPETFLMSATLTRPQVLAVARLDEVQWIDQWSAPETDMNIARQMHGADYVESLGNYLGQGVNVEVLDSGCDPSHPDLQNYTLHGAVGAGSHGTSTSGIICASGAVTPNARGVMPAAKLIMADYTFMTNRYAHTGELQAAPYRAVLQSNSWGSTQSLDYESSSQQLDLILFDFPRLSILQSQSNTGNQLSRPEAWAKNVISVGGINHNNTVTKSDDNWNNSASIGPAADGRIKPDLASYYDMIFTTAWGGGYTNTFGGTSGSTPITAGHLGLFYQMWSDGLFGNSAPFGTVYRNRPQNTTAKAVLINTATQWSFSGQTHDLTRMHQGWGHADVRTLYELRQRMFVVDESDVLTETNSTVYSLTVDGADPLKVTLVYRDWPGTTSSTQHRINDMDLKVTDPSGVTFWGNQGLTGNMWSAPSAQPNTKDTVENVFVLSPVPGTWLVEVIASEINQDTHMETAQVDADYALVVSGVDMGGGGLGTNYCSAVPNSSGLPGAISASGSAAVSDNDLVLRAAQLPMNQFGYLLTSRTQGLVVSPPGSMGNLCLSGTIARFSNQLSSTGSTGSFSVRVDLTNIPTWPPVAVIPGETWHFTTWFRDNNPGATSNFTDGLSVLFN